ncbi:MAG: energy transducer TonB [Candidatus Angelobacter sp.]
MIEAAHKVSDLSQIGPFVLNARVTVDPEHNKKQKPIRLTVSRDHERARVELEFEGRHETPILLGDKQYLIPHQGLLFGLGLREFDRSWDLAAPRKFGPAEKTNFGAVYSEKEQGTLCFNRRSAYDTEQLCFDAAKSMLLHQRSNKGAHTEFSDYASAGGQMFPRKVQIFRQYMSPVEIDDVTVTPTTLAEQIFKVPENAIELEGCDNLEPPKPLYTPEPEFPRVGGRDLNKYFIMLHILVMKEGKVTDAVAFSPDNLGFSKNAEQTVQKWRFKPGSCNGRPVAVEMKIEITYQRF